MADDGGSQGSRSGTERVLGLTRVRFDAATLLVIQGALQGTALRLGSGALTIGAGPSCQLRLSDRGISRKHAQIELRDGQYVVRDLGSMNGTLLNQRQVGEATLAPGDVLAQRMPGLLDLGCQQRSGPVGLLQQLLVEASA